MCGFGVPIMLWNRLSTGRQASACAIGCASKALISLPTTSPAVPRRHLKRLCGFQDCPGHRPSIKKLLKRSASGIAVMRLSFDCVRNWSSGFHRQAEFSDFQLPPIRLGHAEGRNSKSHLVYWRKKRGWFLATPASGPNQNLAKIWLASSRVSLEPMSYQRPGTRQV